MSVSDYVSFNCCLIALLASIWFPAALSTLGTRQSSVCVSELLIQVFGAPRILIDGPLMVVELL